MFTVTNDLTAAFPAKAFRELGMMSIPALDAKAPKIQNDLDGCIRLLVTVNKAKTISSSFKLFTFIIEFIKDFEALTIHSSVFSTTAIAPRMLFIIFVYYIKRVEQCPLFFKV